MNQDGNNQEQKPKFDPSEPHTWKEGQGYGSVKKVTIAHDEAEKERRLFAAMAMQGILSGDPSYLAQSDSYQIVADDALKYADALIVELNKEK